MLCDAAAIQAIKDALNQNPNNLGVGILHEPTGQIHLLPFDQVAGHKGLARRYNVKETECKGFVIGKQPDGTFAAANLSELNGALGQPGSLQMPQSTFDEIVKTLGAAGW
jgi:hypothetical protein